MRTWMWLVIAGCGGGGATTPDAVKACDASTKFTVAEASIGELQQAIRDQRTTCHAVVQEYLDRIAQLDQARELNAVVALVPDALSTADAIDAKVASHATLGPLFCAPILVKDNYDVAGLATTAGSKALMHNVATSDAFMVAQLRKADAVILAKTNMAEWAFFPWGTHSSSFGTTGNAYQPDHTPAGSSGGTASGVAASFGVVGLGSDTGNSIRGPSSHASLFGLRATIGLVSRSGVVPLFNDRDVTGPIARTVEDAAKLFDVISAYDAGDSLASLGTAHHATSYAAALDKNALMGKRIGVLRSLASPADAEVTRLFALALLDLQGAGATLVDPFSIDNLDDHNNEDLTCPSFRFDVNNYLRAHPGAGVTDIADVVTHGDYGDDVKDTLTSLASEPDQDPATAATPCLRYPDHPGRKAFLDDVLASMDRANVDLVVYPSWLELPQTLDNAAAGYGGDNSQVIAPWTGMPAATVPMGFSKDFLPTGLQLLARPYAESLLFGAAYAYEQATHHRVPPPLFAAPASCP